MADPISLMAVAGLVYAGRNFEYQVRNHPKVDNEPPAE